MLSYNRLERRASTLRRLFTMLFSNRIFTLGFTLFMTIIIISLIGNHLFPQEFIRVGNFLPNQPPNLEGHLLGTDSLGRDITAQLFMAVLNSLQIGLIAAAVGTALGTIVGFMSGYKGGIVDSILRIVIDAFLSIPSLIFLVLIASVVKTVDVWSVAMLLSMFSWANPARQARAQMLSLKERDFVYMARLSGMNSWEIVIKEIMPHIFAWMTANFTNAVLWAILTESGLSIMGVGPQGEITLGMMIYWALKYVALFRGLWWWWMTPVFTLIYLFISLYLMHLGMDEVFNPRLRDKRG